MNAQQKKWIDNASYEQLLSHWRFAPIGDPMFQGDTGDYYKKVMGEKMQKCNPVQASKNVGWDK